MEFIDSFELTLSSLLGFLFVPFLYFGYRRRYWYSVEMIRRGNFILTALSIILAAVVLLKMVKHNDFSNIAAIELIVAHLAPLVLTFLLISQERFATRSGNAKVAAGDSNSDETSFNPVPLNRDIERLGWNDLVVDGKLKQELVSIIQLLKDPATAAKYGIDVPKGILLNGPPGTGKTTIAKVIANVANLSFFALRMDEVASKWVGESEKNLSKLFKAAQKHAPAVIFIDEVDSIGKQRSGGGGSQWAENLLNHLLQLVDGVVKTKGLYIIAATNRSDLVDPALKRAGRLNKSIEIPTPDYAARVQLFQLYLAKLSLSEQVNLHALAEVTEGKSCADIKEVCNQAGLNAFKRESGQNTRNYTVTNQDLEFALNDLV